MKTILVDLDGVVYNWAAAMAGWLHDNNAFPEPAYSTFHYLRKYESWEIWDDWGIPEGEFNRWWRLGIEEGRIYKEGPLVFGARRALWKFSDADWHIHIATSRLTKFGLHDTIVENTAYWLRTNNIPYRSLSFTDRKTEIEADVIVDDNDFNLNLDNHKFPIQFGAPHNKADWTWDGIVEALL